MKKLFLSALFFVSGIVYLQAQGAHFHRYRTTYNGLWDRFEVVFGMGFTQFLGDAGGADDIGTNFLADFDFDALRPAFHAGARYRLNHFVAFRLNLTYGILKAHDQYTSYSGRHFRNLGFRSPLFEWGGVVEFYFLPDEPTGNRYKRKRRRGKGNGKIVTGYISTGFNGIYFNPMGDYIDGTSYELALLNTEGQGMFPTRPRYSTVSFSVPVNLGFRFRLSPAFSIDAELCYRKSFTDYMDDISQTYVDPSIFTDPVAAYFSNPVPGTPGTEPGAQRGDPTDNDSYMFLMFTVSWKFSSNSRSVPKYY